MFTWRPLLVALFVAAMLWTIEPVGPARQAPTAPPPFADMASAAALK